MSVGDVLKDVLIYISGILSTVIVQRCSRLNNDRNDLCNQIHNVGKTAVEFWNTTGKGSSSFISGLTHELKNIDCLIMEIIDRIKFMKSELKSSIKNCNINLRTLSTLDIETKSECNPERSQKISDTSQELIRLLKKI